MRMIQGIDNGHAHPLNSVDLLEQAIHYAKSHGVAVHSESLQGMPGGLCRVGNTSRIYLDEGATSSEQLANVLAALKRMSEQARETQASQ